MMRVEGSLCVTVELRRTLWARVYPEISHSSERTLYSSFMKAFSLLYTETFRHVRGSVRDSVVQKNMSHYLGPNHAGNLVTPFKNRIVNPSASATDIFAWGQCDFSEINLAVPVVALTDQSH